MTSKATTSSLSKPRPIRLRIPRVLDVVLISDPNQIQWLNRHPDVTRH